MRKAIKMRILQQFLFLFKSKYRRKNSYCFLDWCNATLDWSSRCFLIIVLLTLTQWTPVSFESESTGVKTPFTCGTIESSPCNGNGDCLNNSCLCHPGWAGTHCQYCFGKVRLNGERGWITDGVGNYTSNMKCTWLIESPTQKLANGSSHTTHILLHIEEFATECGWDHLYIFDGDNVHAPLLSVFSGLLVQKGYSVLRLPEIVAKSGYALLHFYTDVAYNLTGFNITYRTQSCPSDNSDFICSGNGVCMDQQCTCDAKWTGKACSVEKCPNNCSSQGVCDMELHRCQCWEGFKGHDCSQRADSDKGYWEIISPKSPLPRGSASSSAVVFDNSLWIIGGISFNYSPDLKKPLLYRYDFKQNIWEKVQSKGINTFPVYGQSSVLHENKIYLYGGVHDGKFRTRYISNSLWAYDIANRHWTEVNGITGDCKRSLCGPLQLAGHTAVTISEKGNKSRHSKMVVLLGHSPRYGYVNIVQEFHFGSQTWSIVKTRGEPVSGSYGHSSSWDPYTQKIYVFGGYRLSSDAALTNFLHSYDPITHFWQALEPGLEGRFLHSAVVLGKHLYVFGGNAHNDTAYSLGSKCFTSEVLVYDISCNEWSIIYPSEDLPSDLSRFGHISVVYEGSVYLWGGFNGLILSDLVRYTPPSCDSSGSGNCPDERLNVKCASQKTLICDTYHTCSTCVQNNLDCVWCGRRCQDLTCNEPGEKVISLAEQCSNSDEITCGPILHNCPLCSSESHCIWSKDELCLKDNSTLRNGSDGLFEREPIVCERSCADHRSCTNCTSEGCIWCNNLSTCVDKNAYVISFPYGQCMSWSQSPNLCHSRDSRNSSSTSQCNEIASCSICLSLPSCGWCDSGTGTGLGQCMDGCSRGPLLLNSTGTYVDKKACVHKQWSFTTCPACQCNGHSICDEKNVCIACEGFTEGDHCEVCKPGYHGNAVNGGNCKTCECNSQAETCNPETGRCFCSTKGVAGEFCERCDTQSKYAGDPTNGGSCFYDLTIDYQFTFNLSKKEDRHYSQINFKNSPLKPDTDADFQITCSILAKMNISVKIAGLPEKFIETNHNCTNYKKRFLKADYKFGSADNTTFYVYVYGFQPPLWIQISFSQSPKLDLLHFFITFSTCFLLLLMLAGALWKFKQKYDMYRRRQRLFVEMEQMASRPFAQIYIEVGRNHVQSDLSSLRKRRKEWPGPIALEPCHGNRAAVLSCLVSLPTGGEPYVHPGQSGISVASALIALGNPRKVSFEPISKTEGKNSKLRKSLPSHSLNTCI